MLMKDAVPLLAESKEKSGAADAVPLLADLKEDNGAADEASSPPPAVEDGTPSAAAASPTPSSGGDAIAATAAANAATKAGAVATTAGSLLDCYVCDMCARDVAAIVDTLGAARGLLKPRALVVVTLKVAWRLLTHSTILCFDS
jgi:hypothetical protein